MALTLEEKKRVYVASVLSNEMGMSESAAATFAHQWKGQYACGIEHLTTMVRTAIYHEIDIYRKQTYETFGIGISVSAAGRKDPVSNFPRLAPMKLTLPLLGEIAIGYHQYKFVLYHNEMCAKTMHVRLHLGGIQVYFCRAWQPISAYLDEVGTETSEQFNAENALTRQCEWWKANSKSFDIQNLPVELCEIIFDHALPVVAQPYPRHKCRRLSKLVLPPRHAMALMRVNRRTHDITERVLYHTKTFFIKHYPIMKRTLNSRFLAQNIQNLTLSFSHSGYLHLFRFDTKSVERPPTYINSHLRNLNLKALEIHIAAPSKLAETSILEGACQVAVVDLIFDVAWATIKGHPIKISGWVKESQKKRIESLADVERLAYEKWARLKKAVTGKASTLQEYDEFMTRMMEEEQGGVRLDGKAWGELDGKLMGLASGLTIHNLEHYLECRCLTKCDAAGWTCEG
jgi:hypothetical protein